MQTAATMNHIALMLSPRLSAMPPTASVPSAMTPNQTMVFTGPEYKNFRYGKLTVIG
jgi:hypothetical protein